MTDRRDVVSDQLQAFLGAGCHLGDPRSNHDGTGGSRWGELHETQLSTDLVIVIAVETDFLYVEGLGSIDVSDRHGYQLEFQVHPVTVPMGSTQVCGYAEGTTSLDRQSGSVAAMSAVPTITMNDGRTIPQLGFGVFKIQPENTANAVGVALDVGYRHIDTAEMYGNEKQVGQAVRASGLARSEVFVASKLNNGFHRPDDARAAFAGTLADLGLDYVDLFLIHWPLPTLYDGDFVSTWRVLEQFARDGRARSIGVSNFQDSHLRRLEAESETVPAVNQSEDHP